MVTLDAPVTIGNVAFADASHNLELTGSDLTLDVTSGTPDIAVIGGAARTLTIRSATISNDGVSKSGSGKVILTKMDNTFTGDISVAGGNFMIGATANDGVSRQLGGGNFTGNIDIAAGATFEFWTGVVGQQQEFSGVISGDGNVRLAYRGIYTLSGANTYSGKTTIHGEYNGQLARLRVASFNSVVGGSPSSSLGAPTTVANGTVDNSSDYKLMTADLGFTFTDLGAQLETPITGYELQLQNGNTELWLVHTGAGGTPYDTWAAGTFANPFTNTALGVDFDNDGLSNLLEFVLGGDPTISQPGIAPGASTSGTDLVVTFKRSDASKLAPAVTVKVELSTDLTFSTPAQDIVIGPASDPGPIAPNGASYTVSNSGGFDTITVTIPQGSNPKKFARVQAVAP